jgi:NTE family protein
VTRRWLREVAGLPARGTEATVVGPGPEDLKAIGSNLMAVDRRHPVLQTSLVTSNRALTDPEHLEPLPAAVRGAEPDPASSDRDHHRMLGAAA